MDPNDGSDHVANKEVRSLHYNRNSASQVRYPSPAPPDPATLDAPSEKMKSVTQQVKPSTPADVSVDHSLDIPEDYDSWEIGITCEERWELEAGPAGPHVLSYPNATGHLVDSEVHLTEDRKNVQCEGGSSSINWFKKIHVEAPQMRPVVPCLV